LYPTQIPNNPPIPLKVSALNENSESPHNSGMKPPMVPKIATHTQIIVFELIDIS